MRECCTKVVVMTKNISSVSMTSISEITLISKSSWREAPIRMTRRLFDRRLLGHRAGPWRARCRHGGRRNRCGNRSGRRLILQRELVHQQYHLLLHADDVIGHEAAEIA